MFSSLPSALSSGALMIKIIEEKQNISFLENTNELSEINKTAFKDFSECSFIE
jgi:hypothetical protein